jgi:DNA polymerase (family 10)
MSDRENDVIASRLDEIAAVLSAQSANPFRVRAYRGAAATLRALAVPVSRILSTDGLPGLERLRGIGQSLARTIRDIVVHGYSPMLQRLRGESDPVRVFATVPGIGPRLAARLHDELGLDTLAQLQAAAHDGRLEHLAGFGAKRLEAVRDILAERLGTAESPDASPPPVAEILDVDREYRDKAAAGQLARIAPRRLNPAHEAWLPILHTERGGRHYTALFSNTARAHRLGATHDWVVVYVDDGPGEHQWTVITAAFGPLRGTRIVRGREHECLALRDREDRVPAAGADPPAPSPRPLSAGAA